MNHKELSSHIAALEKQIWNNTNTTLATEWNTYADHILDEESYWSELENFQLIKAIEKAEEIIQRM